MALPATPTSEPTSSRPRVAGIGVGRLRFEGVTVLVPLLILVATIAIFRPAFLAAGPLTNVALQASFFGMMALVVVFLLSMGELDISVGAIYALSSIVAAVLMERGLDPWLSAIAGIVAGVAAGGLNAILGNLLRIPMVVVTLGTISAYRGLTILLPQGRSFSTLPTDHAFFTILGGNVLGVPVPVWVFVVATVLLQWVYTSTRFGYVVRAIGSNPSAARLSGISIERARLSAELLMGGMCGVAGILTLAFLRTTDPLVGTGYEILVIAAAIIGGTALSGGSGTVVGAMLGALVISVIRTGLTFFGVTSNWTGLVTGAVIVGAVAVDVLVRRRRSEATG